MQPDPRPHPCLFLPAARAVLSGEDFYALGLPFEQ